MRRLSPTWAAELLAVVLAWLALCAAVARGQTYQSGACPGGKCGVGLGIDLGIGIGGWRNGRAQPSEPRQPLREPAPPQAVRIVNAVAGGSYYATGALVACGDGAVILTCRHTFKAGAGTITITTANGQTLPGTLIATDRSEDLAALAVASCPVQPFVVATEYPRPGDVVRGGGFGGDGQWIWIAGPCRGFVYADRSKTKAVTFAFRGSARQGDSGGPVLNQRGELVGILWGTDGRETFATYSGRIAPFLASLPNKLQTQGGTGDPADPRAKDLLGEAIARAAPRCDCSPVVAKIEAMAKQFADHQGAVAAALTKQAIAVNEQAASAAELHQSVKGLPASLDGVVGVLKKIPGDIAAVKTAVESQKTTIQSQAQIVNQVQQTVAAVPDAIGTAAAASGRTALWTALCGALGVGGPAGVGLAIGLRLLGRAIDRRRQTTETAPQPAATAQRPPEPIVDRQIITAPVKTDHERALQAAVDLYAQRYPGGGQTILSYVSQFESGNVGALK